MATVRNLFHTWFEAFGETPASIHEGVKLSQDHSALREAIEAIANTKNGINTRILGRWFAKHRDQIADGLRLVNMGTKQRATQWKIIKG